MMLYNSERELSKKLSDKFSIDDILAEFSDDKSEKNTPKPQAGSDDIKSSDQIPGATMILHSIDEKKNSEKNISDTRVIEPQRTVTASVNNIKNNAAKSTGTEKRDDSDMPAVRKPVVYKSLDEFEEKKAPAKSRPAQMAVPKKAEGKPHSTGSSAAGGNVKKKTSAAETAVKRTNVSKPGTKPARKTGHKSDSAKVSINSSPNETFADKIKQNRFLFEELTKRDFKKKYKRTVLGILWSVISPFLTFMIQYFVFGYIFNRLDSGFVVYLLTGTLMYTFFNNATTAGMFSMYSNGSILSKVKVPKALFVLSSNSAATFNFLLTLVVYFVFMIACGINFGFHLFMMLYPIICLIIFNIGMSYILSTLFVFFKDIQYLYQIFTMLLTYLSALFYDIRSFPENIQFIFRVNPIYQYISYMRELVMQSTIPSLSHHLICLSFSLGMLGLGVFIHKKTEQKFVYYY